MSEYWAWEDCAIDPTVLVIDDEPNIRFLLSVFLGGEGFKVIQASDGEEGLRLARSERPKVILLDLRMPRMSGADVLRALRADDSTRNIGVIVVSGSTEVEAYDTGENPVKLPADDYIIKPFDLEDLLSKVNSLMPKADEGGRALA